MKKTPSPQRKAMATTILTTMLSGLGMWVYNMSTEKIPQMESRIRVLEERSQTQNNYLIRIDNRVEAIYNHMIDKNE